jgi:hypothetical protein
MLSCANFGATEPSRGYQIPPDPFTTAVDLVLYYLKVLVDLGGL